MKKISDKFGFLLALLGVIIMAYGIDRGEISFIFSKAIRICLECIGIG